MCSPRDHDLSKHKLTQYPRMLLSTQKTAFLAIWFLRGRFFKYTNFSIIKNYLPLRGCGTPFEET